MTSYRASLWKSSLTAKQKIDKVIAWAEDRELFKREALFIRPKRGGICQYVERPIQTETNRKIRRSRKVMILKARQLGITTGALADLFHDFLFRPYTKIAFVAHHGKTATEIFEIVNTFYMLMPAWFRRIKMFRTVKDSSEALTLRNGSSFKVGTSNSEFWRGQTFQHAHMSEAAFYEDIRKTFASIAMAVSDDGTICWETTAKGHNQFHALWVDQKSGYVKVFHSWLVDPEYVHDVMPDDLTEQEREYIETWALPFERACWFVKTLREKCGSDINVFNQEMPIAPEVAFIATGARYFDRSFGVDEEPEDGLNVLLVAEPGHLYVIGADPASGSPTGDQSAAAVLDVTDRKRPKLAATFKDRMPIPDFADVLMLLSGKYNDALVNPELNNHGLALLTDLRHKGFYRLFKDSQFNGKDIHWANQFGTLVTNQSRNLLLSAFRELVATNRLVLSCRAAQYQVDHFVYNSHGKPEHEGGHQDDLLFAVAHACYAGRRATDLKVREPTPVLHTHVEKLEWEMQNGRIFDGEMFDPTAELDW